MVGRGQIQTGQRRWLDVFNFYWVNGLEGRDGCDLPGLQRQPDSIIAPNR
jgi:hypothetical protein